MAPRYRRNDILSCSHLSSNVATPATAAVMPAHNHPSLVAPEIWMGNVTLPASHAGPTPWEAF